MHLVKPTNRKTKLWIIGIAAFLSLFFIIAFWKEIFDFFKLFAILFLTLFNQKLPGAHGNEIIKSIGILAFNCFFSFIIVFLIWAGLISHQALLPVKGPLEIFRTAWHLILHILRRHGPAVFVKDGELISDDDELKRDGSGVMVVDFNSAVVLQERDLPPGMSRLMAQIRHHILVALRLRDKSEKTRVCGPGVIFTNPLEKIRGIVDLRKQFRLQPKVSCYTRDGIEIAANVWAIFTIGQQPDVLEITYVGDHRAENLRILNFKQMQPLKRPGGSQGFYKLESISSDPNELDESDSKEINIFAQVMARTGGMFPFEPLEAELPSPEFPPDAPDFDRDRVFAAVFAQARSGEKETLPWSELPTRVAAGFYRDVLATINYDDLYDAKGVGKFPLPAHKGKVRLKMRNNGILSYRLIYLKSGKPFEANKIYHESEMTVSEIQPLSNSKVLRDRGIKVIASGFGDPIPVQGAIYDQRLDAWSSNWEKDINFKLADREHEAMHVRSRAHAEMEQDLWYALSQLLQQKEFTDEALAVRILQALERAAADTATRNLLPQTTQELMTTMHLLLMPPGPSPTKGPASTGFVPGLPEVRNNGHDN